MEDEGEEEEDEAGEEEAVEQVDGDVDMNKATEPSTSRSFVSVSDRERVSKLTKMHAKIEF